VSEDEWLNLVYILGALVLVSSAFGARRLPLGTVVRGILSWVLIFGVVYVAFLNRDTIRGFFWGLEERLTFGEQTLEGDTVRIRLSPDGHFWANAMVNGKPRRLLIDSGATITAISTETAEAAGVELSDDVPGALIRTANGAVNAKRGSIERLTIGKLEASNLPVVVSPAFAGIDVLGMNFLSQLRSWRVEGRTLILEPKPEAALAD
jgi:aspartyl protease family protein